MDSWFQTIASISTFDRLGWACVLFGFVAGCSPDPVEVSKSRSEQVANLQKIRAAYNQAIEKLGRPPANEKEARRFLEAFGSPDEILKSPVDGEPYVVIWGVNLKHVPLRMPAAIIAYEKTGREGQRNVLTMQGCDLLDEAAFAGSPKIK